MRKERHKARTRKRSTKLILVALVALLCYAAVWLGGKTWAWIWRDHQRDHHRSDEFVPASSYDQP